MEDSPAAPVSADPWRAMHVAIGVTAGRLDITPSEALARMRAHALSHDLLLSEVAAQILEDRFGPDE